MSVIGRLRVVVVKIAEALQGKPKRGEKEHDHRFHRPGRVGHELEDGKDYQSIEYDEKASVEDLLPDPNEKSQLPTELKYVLILNFQAPVPKP